MDDKNIIKLFKDYIKTKGKLDASFSVIEGKDAEMFEETIYLEESILDKFGLPYLSEYIEIINKVTESIKIPKAAKELEHEAIKFLLSTPLTDIKLLEHAKYFEIDPFSILPELKITTHVYTLYVYNEIFLASKDSISNVLREFNIIKNNSDVLNEIGIVSEEKLSKKHPVYSKLLNSKLKYLEDFIRY